VLAALKGWRLEAPKLLGFQGFVGRRGFRLPSVFLCCRRNR